MIFNSSLRERDLLFEKVSDKVLESFGIDVYLTDDFGSPVDPKLVTAEVASLEKVKMWLLSEKNDYIRRPEVGTGIQFELYNKPMTQETATKLEAETRELAKQQVPQYVFTEIKYVPNEKSRTWSVFFSGYDSSTEVPFNHEYQIKRIPDQPNQ